MKINSSSNLVYFGKLQTSQPSPKRKPKKETSSIEEEIEKASQSAITILNPPPGTNLSVQLNPNGKKEIVATLDGKKIASCLYRRGEVIPYEVSEGIDEEKQFVKREIFYNQDGSIYASAHGLHWDTGKIDKKVEYDAFGIPSVVSEGIDTPKGTIKRRKHLYTDGTTNYVEHNINETKGKTAKAVYYYDDAPKVVERVQEGITEDPKTELLRVQKQTFYAKNGRAIAIYYDIQEKDDGTVWIGQVCNLNEDGKTANTIFENAITLNGSMIGYEKGIELKTENGKLSAFSSEKPETVYGDSDDDDDTLRVIKPVILQ